MTSKLSPSGQTFTIFQTLGAGCVQEVKLTLLGGYAVNRTTIVIYRDPRPKAGEPCDDLMELRSNGTVRRVTFAGHKIDLAAGDLERFAGMPDQYQFLLGRRWWRKLPAEQLIRRLHSRYWRTAGRL